MSAGDLYQFPLEPSFVNHEPLDEFIREVADWIYYHANGQPNIEVEAKFGMHINEEASTRLRLPILVESSRQYQSLVFAYANWINVRQSLILRTEPDFRQASPRYVVCQQIFCETQWVSDSKCGEVARGVRESRRRRTNRTGHRNNLTRPKGRQRSSSHFISRRMLTILSVNSRNNMQTIIRCSISALKKR